MKKLGKGHCRGMGPLGTAAMIVLLLCLWLPAPSLAAVLVDSGDKEVTALFNSGEIVHLKCKAEVAQKIWIFLYVPSISAEMQFVRPNDDYCRRNGRYVFPFLPFLPDSPNLYYLESCDTPKIDFGGQNFEGLGELFITVAKGEDPADLEVVQDIQLIEKRTSSPECSILLEPREGYPFDSVSITVEVPGREPVDRVDLTLPHDGVVPAVNAGNGVFTYSWIVPEMDPGTAPISFEAFGGQGPQLQSLCSGRDVFKVLSSSQLELGLTGETSLYVGESGTYTAQVVGGAPPYAFEWDLAGERRTADVPSPESVMQKSFSREGEHTVAVTVTDGEGNSAQSSLKVNIRKRTLDVNFTRAPTTLEDGKKGSWEVTVTGSDLPDRLTYEIDWGDGAMDRFSSSGAVQSAEHTYWLPATDNEKTYSIKVTVYDASDVSLGTDTTTVEVKKFSSLAADWRLEFDYGSISIATLVINDDNTCRIISDTGTYDGTWTLSGKSIELVFVISSGTSVYSGTVNDAYDYMEGSMVSVSGQKGDWKAFRKP